MALSIYDIWAEVSEPLKKYIIKRVPNQTDADDILQEVARVLITAWMKR